MEKEALSALVARILSELEEERGSADLPVREPPVKGSDYRPRVPEPEEGAVADITALDLRKLYLTQGAQKPEEFARLKALTPARLGCGRAGTRYKTLTLLRFRADHAAAQDAVFSQVAEDFAQKNGLTPLQTLCRSKEEYVTRPDRGRQLDEASQGKLDREPEVVLAVGDGLSAGAVEANAPDCLAAIREALKVRGIPVGRELFIRYCRVGAGDHVGSLTGCKLVCLLIGERQGLVTDKSMSAYLTYEPRVGIPESSRTVVSNIHAQGTPAAEAGAYIGELIGKILEQKASGVAFAPEKEP